MKKIYWVRNDFWKGLVLVAMLVVSGVSAKAQGPTEVFPGVWRFHFGEPEKITPTGTRHYPAATEGWSVLPRVEQCPVYVTETHSERGSLVRVPLERDEMIYGLGLQLQAFQERGKKKTLRVNADPAVDTGDSHAPVPFYVTTRGYGVFVDTARYATFYLGNTKERPVVAGEKSNGQGSDVLVEIPRAAGVDVYVFGGPTLRGAVQRYNLFSGGGALPPRWGLGFWYRGDADFGEEDALKMVSEFRERKIPLDVFGLEPGWQTHSYSDSYVWSQKFKEPAAMVAKLAEEHVHLNLWEHAFVHPSAPMYASLLAHSGDYEVWGGLVPDFAQAEAREIFGGYHEKEFAAIGVSGFKLDECDNSDFTGGWSFPEISRFPSGADGEQMHSLFGLRYQDAIEGVFEKRQQRTYGLVRSSGALAAPYPYVLYSDLYDHRQFVRGLVNAGFCGLLWTPEVREAGSPAELLRRLESSMFSPMAIVNAWYLKNPPWKQVKRKENNAGEFADDWEKVEAECREVIELRMKFLPYLHAAFVRYHREGLPPFRALVMDYPEDAKARTVDDEYMMGESVLVAPIIVGPTNSRTTRMVYLPPGEWRDFWTGQAFSGGQSVGVEVAIEQIPLFVKAGAVLPLAEVTQNTEDAGSRKLNVNVYAGGELLATLYEDDGGWAPSLGEVRLEWKNGAGSVTRDGAAGAGAYEVLGWKQIP